MTIITQWCKDMHTFAPESVSNYISKGKTQRNQYSLNITDTQHGSILRQMESKRYSLLSTTKPMAVWPLPGLQTTKPPKTKGYYLWCLSTKTTLCPIGQMESTGYPLWSATIPLRSALCLDSIIHTLYVLHSEVCLGLSHVLRNKNKNSHSTLFLSPL